MQRTNKEKTTIIAEAGVNHNGDFSLAKKLIEAASNAGADYVKFQTFKTELCISKDAPLARYQQDSKTTAKSQYDLVKKLELSRQAHYDLIEICNKNNIKFLSTPFDIDSLKFLNTLELDYIKVPSGEITNLPLLREVNKLKRNVILSTGMSTLQEVRTARSVLSDCPITILHCNTEYPTPMSDVNLNAMLTIKSELKCKIGYSDHTLGIEVPIAAVAMGAQIIEKHFTLDRSMEGPDHKASLEPDELKAMVLSIRNIEKALGSKEKIPSESEFKNIKIARKSIVAVRNISEGQTIQSKDLGTKRPGTGISPMQWDSVVGSIAKKEFQPDEQIKL